DGISDLFEMAGGIDSNCDGVIGADERALIDVDPTFPDGTINPTPSADPAVKDVFVVYDFMVLPDAGNSCVTMPLPGLPMASPDCQIDEYCIGGACRGHSDAPTPGALMQVIQAYAARGIRLHLVRGDAMTHSEVISFGVPIAACSAATASLTGARRAIDFYD